MSSAAQGCEGTPTSHGGGAAERRGLIVSGAGRYADPWHSYLDTSARLASILQQQGFLIETRDDVDATLSALDSEVDLLVVNVGQTVEDDTAAAPTKAARSGLHRYLAQGGPLLAMHSAASAFPDDPAWDSVLGARWVAGTTMHPAIGPAPVRVYPERHIIVGAAGDFELVDERYSYLQLASDLNVLASHEHQAHTHPLLWARQWGEARVVYDALGHDTRSYDSPDHVGLIARAARWLVDDL